MDDRENAPSPDSKCSICLSRMANKSFTDRCFHMFCFGCLVEWSKRNAVCPLCKQSFTQIFHNIKSLSKYDIYDVMSHPSYLPPLSSVNLVSSTNRLSMIELISPYNTPNDNEFVITISPDSSFNDSHVMSRSSSQSNETQPYNWALSELSRLRSHLWSPENSDALRIWLQNELEKISRFVTRINPFNIPWSVQRMITDMKHTYHDSSSFFSAISFYIGNEYTKLFLGRLKSYLNSVHDTGIPHEELESIIESASINTLLNNSPFQENSNGSSLVVDSDLEITNEDIHGGNFVVNHRQKITSTSSDHFISGLIQPENPDSQQPCSFSVVVSIPRYSSNDGENNINTASSSNNADDTIDVEKIDEEAQSQSKMTIYLSSDDEAEVIDLVTPSVKRKGLMEFRRRYGKRVHSVTSDDDDERSESATTSRCKARKVRKKKMKKSHSPQPSQSIAERSVFQVAAKNEVASRVDVRKAGWHKFKKHHSGHKNSLRHSQYDFGVVEPKNEDNVNNSDVSVSTKMEEDACSVGDEALGGRGGNAGRMLAFEALFPQKTPTEIINKNINVNHGTSKENNDEKCIFKSNSGTSSSTLEHSQSSSKDENEDGGRISGASLQQDKTEVEESAISEVYDKGLEVNDVRISEDGDFAGINEYTNKDTPLDNTPLDFSFKKFHFNQNPKCDVGSKHEDDDDDNDNDAIESGIGVVNASNVSEHDDDCLFEKEVDAVSLHSEDSVQLVFHKDKGDDDDDDDEEIVEGGGYDVEEIVL